MKLAIEYKNSVETLAVATQLLRERDEAQKALLETLSLEGEHLYTPFHLVNPELEKLWIERDNAQLRWEKFIMGLSQDEIEDLCDKIYQQ